MVERGKQQGGDTPDQRVEVLGIDEAQREGGDTRNLHTGQEAVGDDDGSPEHRGQDAIGSKPMIDPEHTRQHRAEGQPRTKATGDVVIGDQYVVPVVQAQVGQLVEKPVDRRSQHELGKGGGAEAGNEGATFDRGDESIEGEDQPRPGEEEEERRYRLDAEGGQAV
jgi:hypothetical protein